MGEGSKQFQDETARGRTCPTVNPVPRKPYSHVQNQESNTMANITITLKSGLNALTVSIEEGSTVGSVLANPNYAAVLNYDPSNVEGLIDGAAVSTSNTLYEGDTLLVQKKAHTKALAA